MLLAMLAGAGLLVYLRHVHSAAMLLAMLAGAGLQKTTILTRAPKMLNLSHDPFLEIEPALTPVESPVSLKTTISSQSF